MLFQRIHYSLPFSAFEITGKAVGEGQRKVTNRPTPSTHQSLTPRTPARVPLHFLLYLHATMTGHESVLKHKQALKVFCEGWEMEEEDFT